MRAEDLEGVLAQLADESRSVRAINLVHLSDLTREQTARFRTAWGSFPSPRRRELVKTMVDQAEANIHLSFHTVLRECLTDTDAQVRRLAIEGLWEDERPNLIPRLVALVTEDPVSDVRAAAAISLGRFVLMGALGEIAELLAYQAEQALLSAWYRPHEGSEVRRRALEALAYTSDPAIHDLIDIAYYDEDEQLRQSAVFAMGRTADRRWAKIVLAELRSQDPAMRFEAATSAGELSVRAAVRRLIELLDDSDSNVREAAALALGKIGGRAAREALEIVLGSGDERLVEAAEDALAELTFNREPLDVGGGDGSGDRVDGRLRHGLAAEEDDGDFFDDAQGELDDEADDETLLYERDSRGDDDLPESYEDDDLGWDDESFGGDEGTDDLDWDDEDSDEWD
jgi:hypothetical protein